MLNRKEPEGYTEVRLGAGSGTRVDAERDASAPATVSSDAPVRSTGRRTRPRRSAEVAQPDRSVAEAPAEEASQETVEDSSSGGRGRGPKRSVTRFGAWARRSS